MANRLTDMEITEISLVDEPANEDAKVLIVKSKGGPDAGEGDQVSFAKAASAVAAAIQEFSAEIVAKALAEGFSANPEAADVAAELIKEIVMDFETLTKAFEAAEAKIVALEKRATDAETALEAANAKIAKGAQTPEDAEAEILKSLPESIRKRLADAEEIAKAAQAEADRVKAEAERAEYIAKAKTLKAGDPEKVADLMLRIAKGKTTAEDASMVESILKSAAALSDASELFKSLGTPNGKTELEPEDALVAKAKELQAADGTLTFEKAYDKAVSANPELYKAYIAKRR